MRCPFIWSLIEIPLRFKECDHFQCFSENVLPYINLRSDGSVVCPLCSIKTKISSIVVDPIQYNIIQTERKELNKTVGTGPEAQ